jgi:hypothetical protein
VVVEVIFIESFCGTGFNSTGMAWTGVTVKLGRVIRGLYMDEYAGISTDAENTDSTCQ